MISAAPEAGDQAWRILEAAPPGATVVVVSSASVDDKVARWKLDVLMTDQVAERYLDQANADALDRALHEAPATVAMLAALTRPIRLEDVVAVTQEPSETAVIVLPFTMPVGSSVILGEWARQRVGERLSETAVRQAHIQCLELLRRLNIRPTKSAVFEIVRHCTELGDWDLLARVVNEAAQQLGEAWTTADWLELSEVLAKAKPAMEGIIDEIIFRMAEASLKIQDVLWARSLLDDRRPAGLLPRGRRHALLHEAWKANVESPGAQARMRSHARSAVKCCEEALSEDPESTAARAALRDYRLNEARILQYFDGGAKAALAIYNEVVAATADSVWMDKHAASTAIAARRNAAECLFEFEPFRADPSNRRFAEDHLLEAANLAEHHAFGGIWAEILYTVARLRELCGDTDGAMSRLSQAKDAAQKERFPLVARISDDRLYWLLVRTGGIAFSFADAQAKLRYLELLCWHGWALRVAMKNRLRTARRLLEAGGKADLCRARTLLRQNVTTYRARPGLTGRADRRRVAQSYAGLARAGGGTTDSWSEFLGLDWAQCWLSEQGIEDDRGLWETVD